LVESAAAGLEEAVAVSFEEELAAAPAMEALAAARRGAQWSSRGRGENGGGWVDIFDLGFHRLFIYH
jgi:hypothetical protein